MTEVAFVHPRVVNVRKRRGKDKVTWDVYVGRGACPCSKTACEHDTGWGNPYTTTAHGSGAMRHYLDYLAARPEVVARAREELAGKVLGCWCSPQACHGVILARLADGEALGVIRVAALRAVGDA